MALSRVDYAKINAEQLRNQKVAYTGELVALDAAIAQIEALPFHELTDDRMKKYGENMIRRLATKALLKELEDEERARRQTTEQA